MVLVCPGRSKQPYTRFKIEAEEERYKWSLPETMAIYLNELFGKFVPEKKRVEGGRCATSPNAQQLRVSP